MSVLLVAAFLSVSTAGQTPPVAAAAPAVPPAAAVKPQKQKLICKVEDGDTGSHMLKHTCLTQQQWDDRVQGRSLDEFKSTAPSSH